LDEVKCPLEEIDQKLQFPNDKGYEYSIVGLTQEIVWGGQKASGEGGGALSPTVTVPPDIVIRDRDPGH